MNGSYTVLYDYHIVLIWSAHSVHVWERRETIFLQVVLFCILFTAGALKLNLQSVDPYYIFKTTTTLYVSDEQRVDTSEQGSCWPGWPAWLCPGESSSVTVCIPGHIYHSSSPAAVWSWWTPRTFSVVELTGCIIMTENKQTHTIHILCTHRIPKPWFTRSCTFPCPNSPNSTQKGLRINLD